MLQQHCLHHVPKALKGSDMQITHISTQNWARKGNSKIFYIDTVFFFGMLISRSNLFIVWVAVYYRCCLEARLGKIGFWENFQDKGKLGQSWESCGGNSDDFSHYFDLCNNNLDVFFSITSFDSVFVWYYRWFRAIATHCESFHSALCMDISATNYQFAQFRHSF